MIIRGTTPELKFTLPFETNLIATCFIIIQQNSITIIEKSLLDCIRDDVLLRVRLTQEDTLKLAPGVDAGINLVMKTIDGNRVESNVIYKSVRDTSKGEVI